MWTAIATIAALLLSIWTWWMKNNDGKKKAKEANDKERKDDIASGDIGRIHARIDRLRKH